MYLRYYGFKDYPFSVTPDPEFLYLSNSHREALGHLLYGAGEHGGFVALVGEVGTGKTTLIRAVVDNDMPELDIALCWNPHLEVREFVATICDELGVRYPHDGSQSLKALVDHLNAHLLEVHAAGRRTVLIIDEAQNLSREVLEQLRLLTNLETHKQKLLRIILVGQPELDDLLARHDLRQLAQRITARFRLQALGLSETRAYVSHRLERANGPQYLFTATAVVVLRMVSGGVPRLINMVCERSLMGGYAHGRSRIGAWTVLRAAGETVPRRRSRPRWLRIALPTGALAITAIVVALAWLPDIPLSQASEQASAWVRGFGHQAHRLYASVNADIHGNRGRSAGSRPGKTPAAADHDDGAAATAGTGGEPTDDSAAPHAPGQQTVSSTAVSAAPPNILASEQATAAKPSDAAAMSGDPAAAASSAANAGSSSSALPAAADGSDTQAPRNGFPTGDADINQLLRLWGVFGAQVRTRCDALHIGDLRCLRDRGSFSMVERYNRPALLTLQRGEKRQTVLLSAIDGKTATLVGANGTRLVSRDRLEQLWTGEFQIIWRSDSGVGMIQPGSVGDSVIWLRKHLDQVDGKNPDAALGRPSPVYDKTLEARLQHFQLTRGLTGDGMAGPRTQIMLNGAVPSPGSPALKTVSN